MGQQLGSQDRICIPVPLYHCFGCVLGTLCAAAHGATMVFPSESFHVGAVLEALEHQRCTAVYGVPTMFIAMLEHADFQQHRLTKLRTGIMAGSPCPIELMKRVSHELGAEQMTIGYGQTEASPLITQTLTDDSLELRVGTVGRTLPGIEAKVVDPETGCDLGDMQRGELCSRGHNVMLGYYNSPEQTAAAIDAQGWLHTGDLAMREPNGYYRITGRLRDVIIRGGENIFPREIEELLYQHPAVQDVQIIGVPDRKFGEQTMAWIQLREAKTASEEELKAFCQAKLAHFKVPRYWKFVDSFPPRSPAKSKGQLAGRRQYRNRLAISLLTKFPMPWSSRVDSIGQPPVLPTVVIPAKYQVRFETLIWAGYRVSSRVSEKRFADSSRQKTIFLTPAKPSLSGRFDVPCVGTGLGFTGDG
ncbi:MAG: AMP-binding protein [Pirellulaceae bacterium]